MAQTSEGGHDLSGQALPRVAGGGYIQFALSLVFQRKLEIYVFM